MTSRRRIRSPASYLSLLIGDSAEAATEQHVKAGDFDGDGHADIAVTVVGLALERLCRYILRPPLAQERLTLRPDGRLELAFKRAWRDGTRAIVLEPNDLLVRLCAAVPPPWFNLTRYFGVLSSHSQHRREVTAHLSPTPGRFSPEPATGDQLQLPGLFGDGNATAEPSSGRSRWSWPLAHVFRADLETCSRCGGAMRWVEVATKPQAIARLLAKHGLGPQPPPLAPVAPVAPVGQIVLPFAQ